MQGTSFPVIARRQRNLARRSRFRDAVTAVVAALAPAIVACADPAAPTPPKRMPTVTREMLPASRVDILGYTNGQTVNLTNINNYSLTFDADAFDGTTRIGDEQFAFFWALNATGLSKSESQSGSLGNIRYTATVDASTATGDGSLNAIAYFDSSVQDGVYIKVSAPTSVVASPGSVTLGLDQTAQLTTETKDNWNTDISSRYANLRTWASSNPQVATVSSSGLVTGLGCGSSLVTARAADSRFGATSNPVSVTVSPCRLQVWNLTGPTRVQLGSVCWYTAYINGGTWPYQYRFWVLNANGERITKAEGSSNPSTVTVPISMSTPTNLVGVTVTDATSQVGEAYLGIFLYPNFPSFPNDC